MKRIDHLRAVFDAALALNVAIHLSERDVPEAPEVLHAWAKERDLRSFVDLKHDPLIGSWRVHRVSHAHCIIAITSIIDFTTRDASATGPGWRPSDPAVTP